MLAINRVDVIKETLVFLEKNRKTNQAAIYECIEKSVLDRLEIRKIAGDEDPLPVEVYIPEEARRYLVSKATREEVDKILVQTNEVIWDLIGERILTPGISAGGRPGIDISVTDPERLIAKLREL